jgi:tRNA U34 5-carboxymethylaminomethyl modifying enzyme MnmG/GidA
MTQQEYENKIKELEKQIEELKMAKVEEPQSKRWNPKDDEEYWTVYSGGELNLVDWYNNEYDEWRYLIGNCFETEEEAEEYKKQIEYTAKYKNYIEEHSEPLDWNNENQEKYCVRYHYIMQEIEIVILRTLKSQGTIYASSKQIIKDAICEIGEDNFKKYVLGVK